MKAYPLSWPQGWKVTPATERRGARFTTIKRWYDEGVRQQVITGAVSVADATKRVLKELSAFDVAEQDIIISTNLMLRNDGLPRSGQPEPINPGAAVYWRVDRVAPYKVLAIDQYTRVADNLAAIAATLNAMRLIERHGNAEILTRVFQGFAALEGPVQRTWREILGMDKDSPAPFTVVRNSYVILAKQHHPDNGGSVQAMQELNGAYEAARKEYGL